MSAQATLAERQRDAATRFAAEGIPHRRIEAWHYTDLRSVLPADLKIAAPWQGAVVREGTLADPFAGIDCETLVFTNGAYRADLSHLPPTSDIEIADLTGDLPDWAVNAIGISRGTDESPMADLALAHMTGGVAIRVLTQTSRPLYLCVLNRNAGGEARHIRVLLVLENGSNLTLLESHAAMLLPPPAGGDRREAPEGGPNDAANDASHTPPNGALRAPSPPASGGSNDSGSLTNLALELHLGENATLTHLKIANDAPRDIHVATTQATSQQGSLYDFYIAAGDGALARHETEFRFAAPNARFRMTGLSLLGDGQHADITAIVDHAVRDGTSDLVFKNVLAGKSRGVAQGRIIVRPGADGTDSKQQTRALLLSRQAEADAKPELEIHAEDVVCSHGAAIGQLDAEALFYLRSRGIPEFEARALLTEAFLEEGLARLPQGPAADAMRAFVLNRLRTLEAAP